jgi:hypothetical protein
MPNRTYRRFIPNLIVCILISPCLLLSVVSVFAAPLPSEFEGVWLFADASNNICKPSDWHEHNNDGLILITARKFQEWESECDVLDANIANAADRTYTAKVNLSCGGEGMTWRSTEIWHAQSVGARKVLIRTTLQTDYLDDSDKPMEPPTTRPFSVSVYLACSFLAPRAVAECDEKFVKANAIFIRATVHCKRNYMDSPAGYYALAMTKQCSTLSIRPITETPIRCAE